MCKEGERVYIIRRTKHLATDSWKNAANRVELLINFSFNIGRGLWSPLRMLLLYFATHEQSVTHKMEDAKAD